MSTDSIRQLSNSFPNLTNTRVRFVVQGKLKTEVINSDSNEVIREIPRRLSANVYLSIYA